MLIKSGKASESSSDSENSVKFTRQTAPLLQAQVEVNQVRREKQNSQIKPILMAAAQGAVVGATVGVVAVGAVALTTSAMAFLATLNPLPLVAGLGFLSRRYH
jgi:hypothetical protein